jgi:hypothetical protein
MMRRGHLVPKRESLAPLIVYVFIILISPLIARVFVKQKLLALKAGNDISLREKPAPSTNHEALQYLTLFRH